MAFVACPQCGKLINTRAVRCKYCGLQRTTVSSPASRLESVVLANVGVRWLGLTIVGLLVGSVVGYGVGAMIGLLLTGVLFNLGLLQSESGGWTESNISGAILWLMAAGAVVGGCQWLALPGRPRWGWGWVVVCSLIWGLIAVASLSGQGRLRAVALPIAFPLAVVFSLVGGAVVLLVARAHTNE